MKSLLSNINKVSFVKKDQINSFYQIIKPNTSQQSTYDVIQFAMVSQEIAQNECTGISRKLIPPSMCSLHKGMAKVNWRCHPRLSWNNMNLYLWSNCCIPWAPSHKSNDIRRVEDSWDYVTESINLLKECFSRIEKNDMDGAFNKMYDLSLTKYCIDAATWMCDKILWKPWWGLLKDIDQVPWCQCSKSWGYICKTKHWK